MKNGIRYAIVALFILVASLMPRVNAFSEVVSGAFATTDSTVVRETPSGTTVANDSVRNDDHSGNFDIERPKLCLSVIVKQASDVDDQKTLQELTLMNAASVSRRAAELLRTMGYVGEVEDQLLTSIFAGDYNLDISGRVLIPVSVRKGQEERVLLIAPSFESVREYGSGIAENGTKATIVQEKSGHSDISSSVSNSEPALADPLVAQTELIGRKIGERLSDMGYTGVREAIGEQAIRYLKARKVSAEDAGRIMIPVRVVKDGKLAVVRVSVDGNERLVPDFQRVLRNHVRIRQPLAVNNRNRQVPHANRGLASHGKSRGIVISKSERVVVMNRKVTSPLMRTSISAANRMSDDATTAHRETGVHTYPFRYQEKNWRLFQKVSFLRISVGRSYDIVGISRFLKHFSETRKNLTRSSNCFARPMFYEVLRN